jgi:hypothetical protein
MDPRDEELLFVMPGICTRVYEEAWGGWRWSEPIEIDFPPVPENKL